MRIVVKETRTLRLSGRRRRLVTEKEECVYIPLLKSLEQLLNNTTVFEEVYTIFSCMSDKCAPCAPC